MNSSGAPQGCQGCYRVVAAVGPDVEDGDVPIRSCAIPKLLEDASLSALGDMAARADAHATEREKVDVAPESLCACGAHYEVAAEH